MDYEIKPFVVIKKIGDYDGRIVREFEQSEPAAIFASLLNSSEDKEYIKYYVAEVRIPNYEVTAPSV